MSDRQPLSLSKRATTRRLATGGVVCLMAAGALGTVAVSSGGGARITAAGAPMARVLRFANLPPGWTQVRDSATAVTALSWRYRPTQRGWARPETLRGERLAVRVILRCPGTQAARRKLPGGVTQLPVRIQAPSSSGALPGVPAAMEYQFHPTAAGLQTDIRVAFAHRKPSPSMKGEAQTVLTKGLVLPSRLRCA
jgi:hypothetical protein